MLFVVLLMVFTAVALLGMATVFGKLTPLVHGALFVTEMPVTVVPVIHRPVVVAPVVVIVVDDRTGIRFDSNWRGLGPHGASSRKSDSPEHRAAKHVFRYTHTVSFA